MGDVIIAGIGQIPVGEHWNLPLHSLATRAVQAARADAGGLRPQAMYIGNLLSPVLTRQANLGALLAEHAGLSGIEAYTLEAAEASGAAAFRTGYLAVASGYVDVAVVVGIEKITDMVGPGVESALSETLDYDFESMAGLTPTGAAGLVMQHYLHEYKAPRQAFAEFPVLAHTNAANNPNALYRRAISRELYNKADMAADPLNLFDIGPYADGAAAVILTRPGLVPEGLHHHTVKVTGSSAVIDTLAVHDRTDLLAFDASARSVQQACRQAGILPTDVQLFELCDTYSIYAVLSLEAAGLAHRGEGWKLAREGLLAINGRLPVLTMGGCKARGNPIGATGVYQIVEACQQLRGQAGANQVFGARRAMVQTLGGPASTAVTHILERVG